MAAAERELLFGLIALQNGLVDHDQLVNAFRAWTRDKGRALADQLVAGGGLDEEQRALVDGLVAHHIKKHGGDPGASLSAINAGRSTREGLTGIGDPDIEATLTQVGPGSGSNDDDRTATFSVGTTTSAGLRFRVLRPHARGGLGAVFVALDDELHREVAVKQILDHHADDPTIRQRFLLEAEITGGLEHPGIVPVYGLGNYADGRPYYAMRFIRGDSLKEAIASFHQNQPASAPSVAGKRAPVTDTAPRRASRELELRRLLRRFLDVCNAIDYAHTRGVLHRDIKPGNVIIGKYGETLVVDWGLAKAVGKREAGFTSGDERVLLPSSASGSSETLPGSAMGTPAYMSPEQARGDLDRLGPRSDVYSLGATLYCLLTGRPPFDGENVVAVLRAVQAGEFASPRQVDRSVDPALSAICVKAMALDPENRYETTRALAEDVERWTADEPVTAWREPIAARLRRWGRRHRAVVRAAAVTIFFVALAASISALAIQAARTNELEALSSATKALGAERVAKAEAEENFQTARRAVQDYLTNVSENTLLKQQGRADLRALRKELLDGALKYYTAFIARRGSEAKLQAELADAYIRVGQITEEIGSKSQALQAMKSALAIRQRLADANPAGTRFQRELASCLDNLGLLERDSGDLPGAVLSQERALSIRRSLSLSEPADSGLLRELAASHHNLGGLKSMTGHSAEAIQSFERALSIRQHLAELAPDDNGNQRELAATLHNMSRQQAVTGLSDQAIKSSANAQAILEKLAQAIPDDTAVLSALAICHMNNGSIYRQTGRFDLAAQSFGRALELQQKLVEAHPSVTEFRSNLAKSHYNAGLVQSETGQHDLALRSYARAIEIHQGLADANPSVIGFQRDLAASQVNLGVVEGELGRPREAVRSYERAIAIFEKLAAANPTVTEFRSNLAQAHVNIGFMQRDAGHPEQALQSFRRALLIAEELADSNPTITAFASRLATCLNDIGDLHRQAGQTPEALRSHTRALSIFQKLVEANPNVTDFQSGLAGSHNYIGIVRSASGDAGEASRAYEQALAIRQKMAEANPKAPWVQSDLANCHSNIGYLERDQGRPAQSIKSFERALAIYQALAGANPAIAEFRSNLALCHINIGQLKRQTGRPAEALRSFREALALKESVPQPGAAGLYDLACLLSQMSAIADAADSRAPSDGKRAMADRAMRALRAAVAAGFRDRKHIEKDSDLDPVRARADFQLLMLDLSFPADPFARISKAQ